MKRNFVLVSALAAGLTTAAGVAQTAATPARTAPAAPAATAAMPAPQAVPAKIALIEYEQATAATNEGQRALQELQAKYLPKKNQLAALQTEIESLSKQLQGAPATMSEDEKQSRARTIDTKQKQLQRDGEDASAAFNTDMQEALGKIAQKMGPVVVKYVQDNGYTMLLDNTGQQGGLNIMWGGTDISQAVVDAYNASSGIPAPPPSAPSANRTTPTRPSTTAPRTTTAPKPSTTTPKQ